MDIQLFENQNIVYEMSQVTQAGWKNLANARPVTAKEIMELSEPGDIIVTKINITKVPGLSKAKKMAGLIAGKFLSKPQGLPFISSKLVSDNGEVIGFSADGKNGTVNEVKFSHFITYQSNILLCKYPKMTPEQRKKVIQYTKSKKGLDYDTNKLLTTWWDRLVEGDKLPHKRDIIKKLDKDTIDKWKEALFCSSLLAMAYRSAGINIDVTKNPLDVWPKDFVASKDLEQVAVLYQ